MKFFVATLIFTLALSQAFGESYDGYRVLRIAPKLPEVAKFVMTSLPDVRVWTPTARSEKFLDVMVSPEYYPKFVNLMDNLKVPTSILIEDVQKLIDEQMRENAIAQKNKKASPGMDHTYYRDLDQINEALDSLEKSYPTLFTSASIGTTYEGRSMRLMKVSSSGDDTKPVIWIDCGIHAREWITHASCLYFLDQLSGYGDDKEITGLLETYDFQILTVTNPDGYAYTWSENRVWRKNRYPYGVCKGADLNRNFDSDFGGPGTSNAPCSDIYHGPSAFSELETQAVRDAVLAMDKRIKAFFTIHSYSQLWMTPYGYTSKLPKYYDKLMRVSSIGVKALESVYGTKYQYGSISNIIYPAAGGSVDWTYDSVDIIYSFALELRDKGRYGFMLPANQIEPTARETWEGLKAAIKALPQ